MEKQYRDMLSVSAASFLAAPAIDTSIAVRVYGIGSSLGAVKEKLAKLFGGEAEVEADGKRVKLKDVKSADEITAEALRDFDKPSYNLVDAKRIVDRLTRPGDGCPWDRAQTHESIRINMIEEAYEAVDAIDKHDLANMREEFGDVLLQSLLQSSLAMRFNEFDIDDVCDELVKKLITRHSFIFASDSAGDPDAAITLWEKNKAVEKHYSTLAEQLALLPEGFPSLLYCQKVYKKTVKAGRPVDPEAEFEAALKNRDLTALIAAAAELLAKDGKDAEVELNKLVKAKIKAV